MRVGIVGFGLMGQRRAAVLGEDELVGYVDPMGEGTVSLSDLRDVDAMIVSTPTPTLAEAAIRCMEMGVKRILLEKPCAVTSADLSRVIACAAHTGSVVVPAYTLRHWPGIKSAVWALEYGPLCYIRATYGHGGGATGWRAQRDGGGELLDQGSHLLDLVSMFGSGDEARVISCKLGSYTGLPVEDNVWMMVQLGPALASLHASWTEWKPTFELTAIYTEGRVQVNGLQGPYGPHTIEYRGLRELHRKTEYSNIDVLRDEWEAFRCTDQRKGALRMQRALQTLKLIEEAKRCAS